jgi:hypothetical protein
LFCAVGLDEAGTWIEHLGINAAEIHRTRRNFFARIHSLERFYQRGGADLTAALFEADARVTAGRWYRCDGEVLVTAGDGVFKGPIEGGSYTSRTWIHSWMLTASQEARLDYPSGSNASRGEGLARAGLPSDGQRAVPDFSTLVSCE